MTTTRMKGRGGTIGPCFYAYGVRSQRRVQRWRLRLTMPGTCRLVHPCPEECAKPRRGASRRGVGRLLVACQREAEPGPDQQAAGEAVPEPATRYQEVARPSRGQRPAPVDRDRQQ